MSTNPPTPGHATTEYQLARSSSHWGIVATVLGSVITGGSLIAQSVGSDTRLGIILGALVALAGIIQKTLVSLGYIRSRTDVKTASSLTPGRE